MRVFTAVQAQAEQQGIANEICWLPAMRYELMPMLYGLTDIVINYPSADAFPSTLVEAAACERPIITARLPSYANTFVEEFCTLVEPNQPSALADALIAMVNTPPPARAAHTAAARQTIIDHYEETLAQERLFALYERVKAV